MVANTRAASGISRRQHGEQHRGDERGAEGGADRARELHRGGGLAEPARPGLALHGDLHDAHHRAHEQAVPQQQPGEARWCRSGAHSASTTKIDGDESKARRPERSVVRPVLLTRRPVTSEPVPMPNVSGTSSRPVCRGRGAAHHLQIDRQEGDQRHQRGAVAGGERVAAPDRRPAQQGERDAAARPRGFSCRTSSTRGDDADGRARPPAERQCRRAPCAGPARAPAAWWSTKSVNRTEPDRVGAPARCGPGTRSRAAASAQTAHEPERDVDQEHRVPAEMLGEVAAGHRPERVRASPPRAAR